MNIYAVIQLKYRIQNYSYLSKINEVKQRLSMQREPFYYLTLC